jgi:hypothetical protein
MLDGDGESDKHIRRRESDAYSVAASGTTIETTATILELFCTWEILMGLSLIYGGLGSFIFHASLTRIAQTIDVSAIYIMIMPGNLFVLLSSLLQTSISNKAIKICSYITVCLFFLFCGFSFKFRSVTRSGEAVPGIIGNGSKY